MIALLRKHIPTLYFNVENDAIWSKAPNSNLILIKKLSGRNPELSRKTARSGAYKIKKRNIST